MDISYARYENDRLMAVFGLSMLGFCVIAFAVKALIEPERLGRYSPAVVLHAGLMVSWFGIFSLQAWLMHIGEFGRHILLGRVSIFLAALLVISSTQVAVIFTYDSQTTLLLAVNSMNLFRFALFVGIGIACVLMGYTGLHRRVMLLATIILTPPAVERLADAIDASVLFGLFSGFVASIILPLAFDMASSGIRRSTLLLILAALSFEALGLAFAIGFLQPMLAEMMLKP